jgi:Bifunctional DNA primase/polymerase, N-terminal/AAA domain/Primase C terminal 1 (PriCT-1)
MASVSEKFACAVAYARYGYRVFPCHEIEGDGECSCGKLECSSAGKHPRITAWPNEATTDEDRIRAWWREWPNANIGVACGEVSNLLALDVDVKSGHDGIATLRDLELENGELPSGPIVLTPTGGRHCLFQHESGIRNAAGFADGLDVRSEGGYIVGVGSQTKAGHYVFEEAFKLGPDLPPPKAPEWLTELMRSSKSNGTGGFKMDHGPIPKGQRNDTLFRLGRSLRAKGLSRPAIVAAIDAENAARCVPPVHKPELDRIVEQVFEQPDTEDFGSAQRDEEARGAAESGLLALNVEQLLQRATEPREYVIEPILREKDLAMIFSWRGVGKTLFALDLAYAIASGSKSLKWHAPRPRRVLYIDGELPLEVIKERVVHLVAARDKEPPSPDFLQFITPDIQSRPIPNLADAAAQQMLDSMIAEQKIEVLFIDSISTLCSTGRENEAESWLPIQEWALTLRRRSVAVVFVHHAGKGGAQRGTSRREDILDTVIHLVHPSDYRPEEGSRFEVHFEKNRALWGEALRPFEARLEIHEGEATWTMRDVEDLNRNRAKELFDERMSIRDVAEALGISKSAAARLKTRLKTER